MVQATTVRRRMRATAMGAAAVLAFAAGCGTEGERQPAAPPGTTVNDAQARISYVLPPGWTVMDEPGPKARTSGGWAGQERRPSDGPLPPVEAAYFWVSTVSSEALAGFGGMGRKSAEVFTSILVCPDQSTGSNLLADTEETSVDGHRAWYSEGECLFADAARPRLRVRSTFIDMGDTAVDFTSSAGTPARLDEIGRITASIRIQ